LLTCDNDCFRGYDNRSTETCGYGRRVIKPATLSPGLRAGVGTRQSPLTNGGSYEGLLDGGGNLTRQISRTATFTQSLVSDRSKKFTMSKAATALKKQIAGGLAAKISFTAQFAAKVLPRITSPDSATAGDTGIQRSFAVRATALVLERPPPR